MRGLILFLNLTLAGIAASTASPAISASASASDAAAGEPGSAAPAAESWAFVDVTVIPMDRERELAHQTVLVEGGRIVAVEPAGKLPLPAGARRIDGRGRWLVPGLVDAHVHLTSSVELPLYVANGVTTVFNLNGRPAHLDWRTRIAAGELLGPAIVTTGPTFATSHSAGEAAGLVEAQAAAGYDGVKVYNQVGAAEYPALAAAAHRLHLLFTGHVPRGPGFEAAMRAGQSIAHAEEYMYSWFNPAGDDDTAHVVYDEARIPGAVQLTKEAGVAVTPTLSCYRDILRQATDLPGYLKNPELTLLPPWILADLAPGVNRYDNRYPPDELERMRRSFALQGKLIRALATAGVPILAGTDATTIGPVAGYSLHEELAELVAAGLSPYEALRAATAAPALYFASRSENGADAGTIEPGRRADLVLLAADPLDGIAATRRIEGVMVRGRWLDKGALAAKVDAVPAGYAQMLDRLTALLASDPGAAERLLAGEDPLDLMNGAVWERVVLRDGTAAAQALVRKLRARNPDSRIAGEEAINALGYRLLAGGKAAEAIALFESNIEAFPRSANAVDSLADGWANSGDTLKAAALYRRALEIDPDYANSPFAREFLRTHAAK
jgi:imidazolonepropionase-like amidohydrolase